MEAVTADLILLVQLVRQGVYISVVRDLAVEGGVEHTHLRRILHQPATAADALEGRRAVQRVDGNDGLDIRHGLVVDEGGLFAFFAAVGDAVAHRVDLGNVGDDAAHGVGKQSQHCLQRLVVGGEGLLTAIGLGAGLFMGDDAAGADALADALGQDRAVVHIEQLIFQRRTAGVDDQDLHGRMSSCPNGIF